MNEPQIPQHLLPVKKTEDVSVGVVDETESPPGVLPKDQFFRIGKELGVVTLSGTMMDTLKKVGVDLNTAGVVTTANGSAFVSAGFMLPVMARLSHEALSAKDKRLLDLTHAMHKLATAIDKQNRTMKMDHVGQKGGGEGVPPLRKGSFQPHQHVHFHKHEAPVAGK